MVAELDNCMLGYAILNMVNSEVDAAFIDPNHAGQGIGKKMLYALQDMACVHKLERMHLLASLNAVEFYKSAGFSPIRNERLAHHSGVMLDCVYMEKELSGCTAGKM
jgi:putative acetyltransferase